VIAFVNGQPADGFMGALPENQINAFIDRVTKGKAGGNETQELMKSADAAIAEGDTEGAVEIYSHILEEDKANIPALAGLARCYVATNEIEKAKQILTQVPEAKQNDAAVAAVRAAIEIAEQATSVGPIGELEQKVAANPLDHQARFDLAVALNAAGKRAEAVDQLMEVVRRDRKWNEDGARKQLVQFFEAWGPTDEATVSGRRRLSSILFS
jgi:putative thioredoxin